MKTRIDGLSSAGLMVTALGTACSQWDARPPNHAQVSELDEKRAAQRLVVMLDCMDDPRSPKPLGAGIIVGRRGHVLNLATADHVMHNPDAPAMSLEANCREVRARFNWGEPAQVKKVVVMNQRQGFEYDLLEVEVAVEPPIDAISWQRLQWRDWVVDESVKTISHYGNQDWYPTSGHIVKSDAKDPAGFAYRSDASREGESGGAVFNDRLQLAGMVTGGGGEVIAAQMRSMLNGFKDSHYKICLDDYKSSADIASERRWKGTPLVISGTVISAAGIGFWGGALYAHHQFFKEPTEANIRTNNRDAVIGDVLVGLGVLAVAGTLYFHEWFTPSLDECGAVKP